MIRFLIFFTLFFSCEASVLPWFLQEQIEEDLSQMHFTQKDLDKTWLSLEGCFVRYKWIDGQLTIATKMDLSSHPRFIVVTCALQKVISTRTFKNFDMIVCLEDCVPSSFAPIFGFSKSRFSKNVILMPDCEALNCEDREYLLKMIGNVRIPWQEKKEIAFWRGAPTGRMMAISKTTPRLFLVQLSQKFPALINARFSSAMNLNEELCQILPPIEVVHPKDHLFYKYLIDVDGNTCCFSRTYWILLSNSLLLKQETDQIQWYYKGLIPFVHYVPLQADLNDLTEKVTWCRLHDNQVCKIVLNSTIFAREHLNFQSNLDYFVHLISRYCEKMTYIPVIEKGDQNACVSWHKKAWFYLKGQLRKFLKSQPVAYFIPLSEFSLCKGDAFYSF